MRTPLLRSARARFAATVATVFALVALGGVAATPAVAAPVTVTITVVDNAQGGLLPNRSLTLESLDGLTSLSYTTNGSAEFVATVEEGDYRIVPGGQYVPSAYFTLSSAQAAMSVGVTKPTLTGSIAAAAGSGHTSVVVEIQGFFPSGNAYWAEVSNFVVTDPGGSFAHLLQTGTGTYRLTFRPDASVPYFEASTGAITVDGTVATVSTGTTILPRSGSVWGSVTGTPGGAAIAGATVTASSGGATVATATTAADGSYLLKLAASAATVTVSASAVGYDPQTYPTPVSLSSGNNYIVSSIALALPRQPADLIGNLTQYGGGQQPFPADIYLYRFDTASNAYLATPYGTESDSADFTFTDLPDGAYRLAFRDSDTDQILTWRIRDRDGSPVYAYGAGYGECSIDIMIGTGGDVILPDIEVTQEAMPGYCASPPYSSPSDKTVTGTVLNTESLSPTVYAKLYQVVGGAANLVDITAVNATTGDYSLGGVRENGDYFIQFVPNTGSSYLPTLLGDGGVAVWAEDAATFDDFAANSTFEIDVNNAVSLSDHDVTLVQGALITGTMLTLFGDAIHGQVTFTNVSDPSETLTVLGNGDGWGSWRAVLPVGGTYIMRAVPLTGDYAAEYWNDTVTLADADPIGPLTPGDNGSYEFRLAASPASLRANVSDAADTDPITVHLYLQDSYGLWQPTAEVDSTLSGAYFANLDEGDYRLRFERDGEWLSAIDYSTGTVASPGVRQAGPTCFVDFADVTAGSPSVVTASFDSAAQTAVCAAEPPTSGDVTGRVVSSVATGSETVAGVQVLLQDGMNWRSFSAITNAQGEFTIEDVPNGTYGTLVLPTMTGHVDGTHEYLYVAEETFAGGRDLGDVIPTRFGNVSGQIENWDNDTMAGAIAVVYAYVDCACGSSWEPVGIPVEIGSTGFFEAPGITEDAEYATFIDFDGVYIDTFIEGGRVTPTSSFEGQAELDYEYPAGTNVPLDPMISITGTVVFGSTPVEGAEIYAEDALDPSVYFYAETDEHGNYEVLVDPDADYLVSAWFDPLQVQYYEGYNYDSDFGGAYTGTVLEVDSDAIEEIDFSLIASRYDQFVVRTSTGDPQPGPTADLNGVDVHLYQYVIDGWEEVDTETSYPTAFLDSADGGDYRLRFSKNGEWLRVEQAAYESALPPGSYEDYAEVDACYIDFSDLPHGSSLLVDAVLDPDGSASGCGPEVTAEHYELVGQTVQSDSFANAPIVGQTVTATNVGTGHVQTVTTDSSGLFVFDGLSEGTYTVDIPTAVGSSGYAYESYSETVVLTDDVGLVPLKLNRLGNAELSIANWDSSMAGATAQLYLGDGFGDWSPVGLADVVDSTGEFVIPGIAVDGDYRVWVDYSGSFVDGFAADYYSQTDVLELDGIAEYDITAQSTVAFITVSGIVRLGATAVSGATVTAESQQNGWAWSTTSAADGTFTVIAPAGQQLLGYEAMRTGLIRALITNPVSGYVPITGVQLDMTYATFTVDTYAGTDPFTAHLYRQVAGGWQEVETDTATQAHLWTTLSGSYRLRFSDGADWLAVSEYEINGAVAVTPTPNVCFIDFAPTVGGTDYELTIEPVAPTGGVECAAEPAVVAPPVTPGTTGSGTKKPVATGKAPVATTDEEVVPTSTPTPEPSPSASEAAEPADETVVDTPATASGPDLAWLFWVAGVLVLLILAGGAVLIFRRR
jgi:hypothetical protein